MLHYTRWTKISKPQGLRQPLDLWTSQRRHQSGLDAHNYATEKTVVRYVPTVLRQIVQFQRSCACWYDGTCVNRRLYLFGTWIASESYLRFSQRFLSLSTASVFESATGFFPRQSASFSYCIDLKRGIRPSCRVYFEESGFLRLSGCEAFWPPCSGVTKLLSTI